VTSETAPTPSKSGAAKSGLTFKTEAATQAASAYLEAYSTLINDINAQTIPKGSDPKSAMSNAMAQLQAVTRDNAEVSKLENKVRQALTPDEVQRLLQYRKSLEQTTPTGSNEL
jgi:DNA-binding transcriptional regulator GbsR (MarR family)